MYLFDDLTRSPASLEAAAWSPLDSSGLRLVARATPLNLHGTRSIELEIQIDPRDLTLQPEGDPLGKTTRWRGTLRALLVQLDAGGHNLKGFSQTYTLDLGQQNYQRVAKEGFVMRNSQTIVPGANRFAWWCATSRPKQQVR